MMIKMQNFLLVQLIPVGKMSPRSLTKYKSQSITTPCNKTPYQVQKQTPGAFVDIWSKDPHRIMEQIEVLGRATLNSMFSNSLGHWKFLEGIGNIFGGK